MIGKIARSKAGHDKDQVYLIIGEQGNQLLLADGALKTVLKPKKKNRKHIQPVYSGFDSSLEEKLKKRETVTDLEIRMLIKDYLKKETNVN